MSASEIDLVDDDWKSSKVTVAGYEYFEHKKYFLGNGSFGEVYSGRRGADDLRVAIKKIPQLKVEQNEIDIMQSVNHENVLQLLHVGMNRNHLYMITELCTFDLSKFLQKCPHGRLSLPNLYKATVQLVNGYEALYDKNIIHRNIKPANILVVENGDNVVFKIADFGCGKFLKEQYVSTFAGTVKYMAPELGSRCVDHGNSHYDHRADIWSLGVVLYECAAGKFPFTDEQLWDIFVTNALTGNQDLFKIDYGTVFKPTIENQLEVGVYLPIFGGLDLVLTAIFKQMLKINYKERLTAKDLSAFVSSAIPAKKRILVIGESGKGKSSIIKLLTGIEKIAVSDGAIGCTFSCNTYEYGEYVFIDTTGLSEGSQGTVPDAEALTQLVDFLRDNKEGFSLVVMVRRKGDRISNNDENNYELFCRSVCKEEIPTLLVVTGCENDNPMNEWWDKNKTYFDGYKMKFADGICVSAASDEWIKKNSVNPEAQIAYANFREQSKINLIEAFKKHTLPIPLSPYKGLWRAPFILIVQFLLKLGLTFMANNKKKGVKNKFKDLLIQYGVPALDAAIIITGEPSTNGVAPKR